MILCLLSSFFDNQEEIIMTMPTMADVRQFIFNHDEWLKNRQEEWEIANFIETVEFIANRHYINNIPAIADIKAQAGEIVRAGVKWHYYDGLDISQLITDDGEGKNVRIWEQPFGRVIPLGQLYDWVIEFGQHDAAVRIDVDFGGMTVTTSRGHTIKLPGCEIYLGRLAEDGRRYRLACELIKHITGGQISMDYTELIGKTETIHVEMLDDVKWGADFGVHATS